jgi:hypothetical protein
MELPAPLPSILEVRATAFIKKPLTYSVICWLCFNDNHLQKYTNMTLFNVENSV